MFIRDSHHTGKAVTLAEDIDGEANGEHFKAYLSAHLKLKSPGASSLKKSGGKGDRPVNRANK